MRAVLFEDLEERLLFLVDFVEFCEVLVVFLQRFFVVRTMLARFLHAFRDFFEVAFLLHLTLFKCSRLALNLFQ